MHLAEQLSSKYSPEVMEVFLQIASYNNDLVPLDVKSIQRANDSAPEDYRKEYLLSVVNELFDYSELQKNYDNEWYYYEGNSAYPRVEFQIKDGGWFTSITHDVEHCYDTVSLFKGPYSTNMMILQAYLLACKFGHVQMKKRLSLLVIQAMDIDPVEAESVFIKHIDSIEGRKYTEWHYNI